MGNTMFIHFGGLKLIDSTYFNHFFMGIICWMWSIGYHFFDGKHKGKPMDDQSHSEWLVPTHSHNFPKDAYIPQTKSWWNVLELYWTYLFWRLRWWAFGIIGRDYKPWSCHVLVGFMPCLFNTMMTWRNFDMVADHFWFLGWTSECIFRIWLTPHVSLFVLWMVLFCRQVLSASAVRRNLATPLWCPRFGLTLAALDTVKHAFSQVNILGGSNGSAVLCGWWKSASSHLRIEIL